MPAQAEMCWLCLQKKIHDEPPPPNPKRRTPPPRHGPGTLHFDISFALLALMVILICGVLAYEMPGILIVFAIVLAPVLIRSVTKPNRTDQPSVATAMEPGHRKPPPEPSAFKLLFDWIGVVILMGVVAFGAFCAAFFAICTGGLLIAQARGTFDFFEHVIIACMVGGIVAAVLGAAYVFQKARPH